MSSSNETINDTSELFPIRTVCSITGVNPITLRAWERRYGLIQPHRTDKGHRLYTQADIERIQDTVALLDKGISVSQVRKILDNQSGAEMITNESGEHWSRYTSQMIHAISQFDEKQLDQIYNEALSLYPINVVMQNLVFPLLKELGKRWLSIEGGIAEEHFFGVFLRHKLGARFHHLQIEQNRSKLLLACLPNELHEVGLLLFALFAKSHGYDVIMLGANMPLEELSIVLERTNCRAVVLAGTRVYDYTEVKKSLAALVKQVSVPVFVGGNDSTVARDVVISAGAIPLGEDIDRSLNQIERVLNRAG